MDPTLEGAPVDSGLKPPSYSLAVKFACTKRSPACLVGVRPWYPVAIQNCPPLNLELNSSLSCGEFCEAGQPSGESLNRKAIVALY